MDHVTNAPIPFDNMIPPSSPFRSAVLLHVPILPGHGGALSMPPSVRPNRLGARGIGGPPARLFLNHSQVPYENLKKGSELFMKSADLVLGAALEERIRKGRG